MNQSSNDVPGVYFFYFSQYPVLAVDGYLPISNPLTGRKAGELKVLLAMGTQQQIMALDTLKVVSQATQQRSGVSETYPHHYAHQL